MAEPEKKEEEKEEKEEQEEKKEEPTTKTVEKVVERDREPALVDCPECDLSVREDKLGSHRWKAHQVERRAGREKTDDKDDGIAPPKKTKPKAEPDEKKPEPTGLFGAWKR